MTSHRVSFLRRWLPQLVVLSIVGMVMLLVCARTYDVRFVEKLLTQVALPCGVIWLGMGLAAHASWLRYGPGASVPLLGVWLLYWLCGSPLLGEWLLDRLEAPYRQIELNEAEPFDAIVVLGGGSLSDRRGRTWLSVYGDRVMRGARLFHQGFTKRLIATGQLHEWSDNQTVDPAGAAVQMWLDLHIPRESVEVIGGRNTSQEMEELAILLNRLGLKRVGLVTSAFHLPRAMRLASQHGLQLEPIAADFQSGTLDPVPLSLVPSSIGFRKTEIFLREFLAARVGR